MEGGQDSKRLDGGYMAVTWWKGVKTPNGYMAVTWRLHGGRGSRLRAVTWRLHGGYMAVTWWKGVKTPSGVGDQLACQLAHRRHETRQTVRVPAGSPPPRDKALEGQAHCPRLIGHEDGEGAGGDTIVEPSRRWRVAAKDEVVALRIRRCAGTGQTLCDSGQRLGWWRASDRRCGQHVATHHARHEVLQGGDGAVTRRLHGGYTAVTWRLHDAPHAT
jgi:hypothetical protein